MQTYTYSTHIEICTNDETSPSNLPKGTVAVITHYYDEGYEGSGTSIAITKNGDVYEADLSHNSCCDAFDGGYNLVLFADQNKDLLEFCNIDEIGCPRTGDSHWQGIKKGVEWLLEKKDSLGTFTGIE